MDAAIREWIMGYTCGLCHAEVGSTRQAGVLVLARDAGDLEVLGFCYKHAAIYVVRWREDRTPTTSIRLALYQFIDAGSDLIRSVMNAMAGLFGRKA